MKIFNLTEKNDLLRDVIKITDEENFFNIYFDNIKKTYCFNLNSTLYFKLTENDLETYILKTNMFWTTISYNIYGTTRLWWLLIKLNNISDKDVLKIRSAGEYIKFLNIDKLKIFIETLNSNNE